MKKFLFTILTTVLAGLLLKAGEAQIASLFATAPIQATAVVGPYAPIDAKKEEQDLIGSPLELNAIAIVTIRNGGSTLAKDLRFRLGERGLKFRAISLASEHPLSQAQDYKAGAPDPIALPDLPPGDEIKLAIAVGGAYSIVDSLRASKIYSSAGVATPSVSGTNPNGQEPVSDSFLVYIWDNVWFLLSILSIIAVCIAIGVTYSVEHYLKVLLTDQDFYLSEAQRYHDDPKNFKASLEQASSRKVD